VTERPEITLASHFLWLISRVIDWPHAFLVLCALSKTTVMKLKENQRLKLIKHIIKHRLTSVKVDRII
jgi:hypothetical protein